MSRGVDKYWRTVGPAVLIATLGAIAFGLAAVVERPPWPVTVAGIILLLFVGLPLRARWLSKRTVYTRAKCKHRFQVSARKFAFS